MNIIEKYFPHLTELQRSQYEQLQALYTDWNTKINVISRKDIDMLMEHHVLHSLGIARYTPFAAGSSIIDVGTGGGFPGIPLAIMFPDVCFTLVDSIGKKIRVVNEVATALGLKNVTAIQKRAEEIRQEKFDFVVSRAVTAFPDFVAQTRHLVARQNRNGVANGILYLKGGDFADEVAPFGRSAEVFDLSSYFEEEYFSTKRLIHLVV
ncbi:MAG: 16S rRNA (guanine(527)-N(7))-methyltransferase RsmG [Bacteroidales bacterium]|nr:16S rRNA (guanine(527)-N(7))-methyltransferase RsmG [Bacteroidales bacterium]